MALQHGVYAKTDVGQEGGNGPEESGMPTSTQCGSGAEVTALAKKVVVVVIWAPAMII